MKRTLNPILVAILLCQQLTLFSQKNQVVYLHTGLEVFPKNLEETIKFSTIDKNESISDNYYRLIQFYNIPNQTVLGKIKHSGIQLLEYIPSNTYIASIPNDFEITLFREMNVRSIQSISPAIKLSAELKKGFFPDWAVTKNNVLVNLKFHKNLDHLEVKRFCEMDGIGVLEFNGHDNFFRVSIPKKSIKKIAEQPYVAFLELVAPPDRPDDNTGRAIHRSNAIDVPYASGRHYNGEGVGVLCRDDGMVGPHIDFQGRIDNSWTENPNAEGGAHGDGVCGIIGGAGNLDPKNKGMASGADIYVVDYQADFLDETMELHLENGVLITNSSYSNGCNQGYTGIAETVDQQLFNNPTLMHVFSAGNSNNLECGYGAGEQWGNITGGHKQAKNCITVANINSDETIENTSSRGPAHDGRIKPDIAAFGEGHISTAHDNTYQVFGGTSAAAPSITGVIAQLHQAYRELNNGETADAALLKAVLLNTANDLGNKGPDFIYGWGQVNSLRAVMTLETGNFAKGVIFQGQRIEHPVLIPDGVVEARVMLYWNEPAASSMTSKALVNNLDASLSNASGESYLPWVLNSTPNPTLLNEPATKGIDDLNNMEQVVIEKPVPGAYTFNVHGKELPFGALSYFVVWEFITEKNTLTHPIGGESFAPGDTVRITWDAVKTGDNFTLFYSTNGGQDYSLIGNAPSSSNKYDWVVPNSVSGNTIVKILRGNSNLLEKNEVPFSIVPKPMNLEAVQACPDYIKIKWEAVNLNPISATTSYEIFLLGGKYMEPIGVTTATEFDVPTINDNPSNDHWIAVRAKGENGLISERTHAILYNNGLLNCSQQNDLTVLKINSPGTGPLFGCGSAEVPVKVTYQNIGTSPQSNVKIAYALNANAPVIEIIPGTILPDQIKSYEFNKPMTVSGSSQSSLKVFTILQNDLAYFNDSMETSFSLSLYNGNGEPVDYKEDFDGPINPPPYYSIINPDEAITWTSEEVIGANGALTNCMFMNNYSYGETNQEDDFLAVPIDLRNVGNPILSFNVAYAQYNSNYFDGLRVGISTDCGQTFNNIIYEKQGEELSTTENQNQLFLPASESDWRKEEINLSDFIGHSVVLKFTNINGYGNSLFIDNISVTGSTQPNSNFNISNTTACVGETIVFTNSANEENPSYYWQFGNRATPSTSTMEGPIEVTFNSPGIYTITLSVTNVHGSSSFSQIIEINETPKPNFDYTINNNLVAFENNSEYSDSFIWYFGDGSFSTEHSPTHEFNSSGKYDVKLEATNICGTVTSNSVYIETSTNDTGINPSKIISAISPNPNNGVFKLYFYNLFRRII